jgi:hypothetical protein
MKHFQLVFIFLLSLVLYSLPQSIHQSLPQTVFKCAVSSYSFISAVRYYRNVITYRPSFSSQNYTSLLELEPYLTLNDIEKRMLSFFPNFSSGALHADENDFIKASVEEIFRQYNNHYKHLYNEEVSKTNNGSNYQQNLLRTEIFPLVDCLSSENVSSNLQMIQSGASPIDQSTDSYTATTYDASKYLTVVSGYWKLDKHKYSPGGLIWNASSLPVNASSAYDSWFASTLQINMPYIIFTDESTLSSIAHYRYQNSLPTIYLIKNLSSFLTVSSYNTSWIHPLHVPSVELGIIWLEKIHLLKIASQLVEKPFLAWIDAGISRYRHHHPPTTSEWSSDALFSLPLNRISYIYVEEDYHSFTGGVTIIPKTMISLLDELFYNEYEIVRKEVNDWRCGSDQFILTRIRNKYPHLFHIMSYDYGDIDFLWGKKTS